MLDEREGPVAPEERASRLQPADRWRSASPSCWPGRSPISCWRSCCTGCCSCTACRACVRSSGRRLPDTPAAHGAVRGRRDLITRIGDAEVATWQDVRWVLLEHALRKDQLRDRSAERTRRHRFQATRSVVDRSGADRRRPAAGDRPDPVPARAQAGDRPAGLPAAPAERDGLQPGDEVVAIDGQHIAQLGRPGGGDQQCAATRAVVPRDARGRRDRFWWSRRKPKNEGGKTSGASARRRTSTRPRHAKLITEVRYGPVAAARQGGRADLGSVACSRSRCWAR